MNRAQGELAAHREAHGEEDASDAPWSDERRRLTETVTAAVAEYEDCVRAHNPALEGTVRPTADVDPNADADMAQQIATSPAPPTQPVARPSAEPDAPSTVERAAAAHAAADRAAPAESRPAAHAAPIESPATPSAVSHAAPSAESPAVVPSYISPSGQEPASATANGPAHAAGVRDGGAPQWLRDALLKLETHPEAEKARLALRDSALMRAVPESVWSALRGDRFGHAIHPALTDFPLGSWIGASLLDLTGMKRLRPAATALVGIGVAAVGPVAWTGWAEWREADERSQRVGVVHAALNGVAALCYGTSLVLRLTGRHRRAVGVGMIGGGLATVSGYLGGHMTLNRHVGTADPAVTGPTSGSVAAAQ